MKALIFLIILAVLTIPITIYLIDRPVDSVKANTNPNHGSNQGSNQGGCTSNLINKLKAMTPAQITALSDGEINSFSSSCLVMLDHGFPSYPQLSSSLSTAQYNAFYNRKYPPGWTF